MPHKQTGALPALLRTVMSPDCGGDAAAAARAAAEGSSPAKIALFTIGNMCAHRETRWVAKWAWLLATVQNNRKKKILLAFSSSFFFCFIPSFSPASVQPVGIYACRLVQLPVLQGTRVRWQSLAAPERRWGSVGLWKVSSRSI